MMEHTKQTHMLTINAKPHKPVHLTSHHLDTWFARLDNPGKPIEARKTLLDSFRLNDSHDVLHFLDSPIGHAMKAQLSEALAHMAMFQKEGQRHARELLMAKSRRLAFLHLDRLHKKELAAKKHRLFDDHEAAHQLERDYQIVKDEEKCYLLQAKQNLTALSLEEKDTAHLAYQALRLEPQRMTAHRRITKEHQALRAPPEAQQLTVLPQIAQLQQEKMTLTTQLNRVFQSRLKAIETLNRVQQLAAASSANQPAPSANPTPTLRPMPSRQSLRPTLTPELRSSYAAISQALRNMAAVALVQNNPGLRLPMRSLPRPIQLGKLPGDQIKQVMEALVRYGIAANPLATRPYTIQAANRSAPRPPSSTPRPFGKM